MQDAFTKTIPIWCSVLNTAIQRQRQAKQPSAQGDAGNHSAHGRRAGPFQERAVSPAALADSAPCTPSESPDGARLHRDVLRSDPAETLEDALDFSVPLWKLPPSVGVSNDDLCTDAAEYQPPHPSAPWDCSLHFPSWISRTEHSLVTPNIAAWASDLLSTCQNSLPDCLLALDKPLRPVWLSQSSLIWTNHVAPVSSMPFTPLYLVSTSLPLLYHRKVTRIPRGIDLHGSTRLQESVEACEDADETVSYVYEPPALAPVLHCFNIVFLQLFVRALVRCCRLYSREQCSKV